MPPHVETKRFNPRITGRFPIRVELESLTTEDFVKILKEPKQSLLEQYKALLETEMVTINLQMMQLTD